MPDFSINQKDDVLCIIAHRPKEFALYTGLDNLKFSANLIQ